MPVSTVGETPYWVFQAAPHVVTGFFAFAFGACVGSFANVLVYRLPAGISVITPPSRCPSCGGLLRWYENLPILGWVFARGRCRRCGIGISPQYVIVELITALLFLGLYLAYYAASPATTWWGAVGGPWWYYSGPWRTLPAFSLHALLLAGLLTMTLIDARTFTIPIQLTAWLTVLAVVLWPIQGLLPGTGRLLTSGPIPVTDWPVLLTAAGGMLGVVIGIAMLRGGLIRPSFADYDDYVAEGETLGDYPHARREMLVELAYLAPCLIGLVLGWLIGRWLPDTPPPAPLALLGGSLVGYLVGAGLVWAVRILGTLGFGREAMGLGDVHLMGAVGAVLGWQDPIWIFFLAPFPGLLWALLSRLLGQRFAGFRRELPYGPHLAVATVLVIFGRPAINAVRAELLPTEPRVEVVTASATSLDNRGLLR